MFPYFEDVARQRIRELQQEAAKERLVSAIRAGSRRNHGRGPQPAASGRKAVLTSGKRNRLFLRLYRQFRSLL